VGASGRQTIVSDSGEAIVKGGECQEMVSCMMNQFIKASDSGWGGFEGGRSRYVGGEGVRRREVADSESGEMASRVETLEC
jgi:hypothetical protein